MSEITLGHWEELPFTPQIGPVPQGKRHCMELYARTDSTKCDGYASNLRVYVKKKETTAGVTNEETQSKDLLNKELDFTPANGRDQIWGVTDVGNKSVTWTTVCSPNFLEQGIRDPTNPYSILDPKQEPYRFKFDLTRHGTLGPDDLVVIQNCSGEGERNLMIAGEPTFFFEDIPPPTDSGIVETPREYYRAVKATPPIIEVSMSEGEL